MSDYTTTTRVAAVVWRLAKGDKMTTAEVSVAYGISRQGAHSLMSKLALEIPITVIDGAWVIISAEPQSNEKLFY